MYSALVSGLSAAALAIIARLVTREILEKILETLVINGMTYIAKQTENTVDDEIARFIAEKLRTSQTPKTE